MFNSIDDVEIIPGPGDRLSIWYKDRIGEKQSINFDPASEVDILISFVTANADLSPSDVKLFDDKVRQASRAELALRSARK